MFCLQDLIQCFCLCGGSSKQADKVHRSDPPMPANVFLNCISQLHFLIVFLNIISQLYFAIVHSYNCISQLYFSTLILNCISRLYFSNCIQQLVFLCTSQLYFAKQLRSSILQCQHRHLPLQISLDHFVKKRRIVSKT